MISARFVDDQRFCDHYKRNNKAKGRKNLRCYPACRASGHIETGYCGRPVRVQVSYDADAAAQLDLMAFAEFRPKDPAQWQWRGVTLGDTMSLEDIFQRTRSRGSSAAGGRKVLNPWFPGTITRSSVDDSRRKIDATFSFNQGNQGWHYAWQSHRMTRMTEHCLYVFILAGQKLQGTFTCVSELSSPAFDIHCRRKRSR